MAPRQKVSVEERKLQKRLAEKRRFDRLKNDPDKALEMKVKNQEKKKRQKQEGGFYKWEEGNGILRIRDSGNAHSNNSPVSSDAMKLAAVLVLSTYHIVCCAASSAFQIGRPSGPFIAPVNTGQCSWQACVTDKSVCICMPSLIGVPSIKCNPVKEPKQNVFPRCLDVMFG